MSAEKVRLDEALVTAGLAASRARARDMILRGAVSVDGIVAAKPALRVASTSRLSADDPAARYVSRAALKLIAGLDHFGLDPRDRVALDVGASTGGFTQVLLERGAQHVIAVDVGHDQMAEALKRDPRVTCLEGLNARDLNAERIGGVSVTAIVADVSFISLRLALPPALALASPGAWGLLPPCDNSMHGDSWLVALVKPQFEVGREHLGKGGIVRDQKVAQSAAEGIAEWVEAEHGWTVKGLVPSPIAGGDGNQEWLLGAVRSGT